MSNDRCAVLSRVCTVILSLAVIAVLALSPVTALAQGKGKKAEPVKKEKPPAKVEPTPAPAPAPAPAQPKGKRMVVTRVAVYDLVAAGDIKPRTAVIVSEAILAEIRKI